MTTQAPATQVTRPEGQHGFRSHSDGAGSFVPVQTRSERFASTRVTDFDEVTGREAVWKLSPVDEFRDLLSDTLDGSPVEGEFTLASGTTVEWIPQNDSRVGRAGTPEDRAAAAAWSNTEQALLVTVSGESSESTTINRTGFGTTPRAAHTVITAQPHSRGTVILDHRGPARLTENVEIIAEDGASLTVVSVQDWDDEAVHLSSHFARVGRDAHVKHVVVSLGGRVVRLNPSTHLAEQGSGIDALGVYFADAHQHLEQQVYVHHDAPHSRSRVSYKGALQGAGAHTVWIGDVLIGPNATATDSYEQNRNLVLTDGTRADSIPNLEIETGDIAGAGHASATGRFDDEQLFYLQARGIDEVEARRLVVLGFLFEIVQQIGDEQLEARLQNAIETELRGTAAGATAP